MSSGITLHLQVEARSQSKAGLGTILSLDDGHRQPHFLLAQYHDWLILRVRSPPTAQRWREYWEIGAKFALPAGRPRLLTLTSSVSAGTALYVDGELRRHDSRSIFEAESPAEGRWILGATPTARAGWQGRLQRFLAYPRVLDAQQITFDRERLSGGEVLSPQDAPILLYEFTGQASSEIHNQANSGAELELEHGLALGEAFGPISIPETLEPTRLTVLRWPSRDVFEKNWFQRDALRNLIGFIPLGWLWVYARERKQKHGPRLGALIAAIALGGALSAAIELTQVFQPGRISSVSDLALNTLGSSIGACAAFAGMRLRRSR